MAQPSESVDSQEYERAANFPDDALGKCATNQRRNNGDDGGDSDQPGSNAGLLDHLRSDPHKVRLMPHLRRATRAI